MQLTKWLMNLYKYKRSRSFIGLGQISLRFNILLFLSLETAKSIEAKFHLYPPWDGETKVCSNGPVTWPIWPSCPYMVKIFNNRLLWNQKADGLESWVFEYYQMYSSDDPGLTLTYFTTMSNLVPYAFVWKKGKTMNVYETIKVNDIKVGRCS